MPQYVEVNGNVIEFPDGMAAPDMEAAIKANFMSIKPAAAVGAGKEINSIPRQLGLTARYGMEGLANAAQLVTEPIRAVTDLFTPDRPGVPKSMPLGVVASQFADKIGLPKPEGANERVIGDATRLVAGAGGMGGLSRMAAAAPGAVGRAGEFLSANMGSQLSSAAGAGLAGGASREGGGSPLMQGAAAFAGGVAGGLAPGAAGSLVDSGRRFVNSFRPQQLDVQVQAALERAGVNWAELHPRAQQALRNDLASALNAGQELDPAAVRRLADFRAVGATPTRGMVSLDPVQITREQNLAKIGANSADQGLHGLARLQNQNNATFIRNLDEAGAAQGDPMRAGRASIGSINARDQEMARDVTGLYSAAREMPGGEIPLDRKTFVDNIFAALNRENKLAYLPESIGETLNNISRGQATRFGQTHNVPFDAKALDNLLTDIAAAQRSAGGDGNARAALTIARRAIDSTSINPVKNTFGGNQVVTEQGAQFLRSQDAQAGQFMDALNQARAAAARRFGWRESAAPIEAAVNGAEPDHFFRNFVVNGTVADARAVAQNAPREEVRNAILAHLKDKALSDAESEVGKFSQAAYNKAVKAFGDEKLSLFFSPDEVARLHALRRAASYAKVQPDGSAVNNSNSGALMLGKALDALAGFSNSLPVIGPMVSQPITSGIQGLNLAVRTNQAQNVVPSLLMRPERLPMGQGLLLPGLAAGGTAAGLLAAP